MADISELGLTVLAPLPGFEFRPTGSFLFRDRSGMLPQKILEAWRDHPRWGFQSRNSCTANPVPGHRTVTECVADLAEAQPFPHSSAPDETLHQDKGHSNTQNRVRLDANEHPIEEVI